MSERKGKYFAIVRNPETGVFEDSGIPSEVLEALRGEIDWGAANDDSRPICEALGHNWVPSPFDARFQFCDVKDCGAMRKRKAVAS